MSEKFHIYILARSFVSLTVCFALSLILVFGSVLSYSSFALPNTAFAVDMEDAPATTEAATDAPPGNDNEGDNDDGDEDTQVTTRTFTVEEDGDNDNKKKQDSNEAPKAVELGKCTDPNHEHDPFTNECKPITPLTETQTPACSSGILSGFVTQEVEHEPSNNCANTGSEIGDEHSQNLASQIQGDENTVVAPVQSCFNQPACCSPGIGLLSPNTNDCVNAPMVDHPSTSD